MTNEYIKSINDEYGTEITGISPLHGNKAIPKTATKIVVRDFGNGLGRAIYVDTQNRLIANIVGKLS